MTAPREMSRAHAARLVAWSLGGSLGCAVMAGVLARIAAPLGGTGAVAGVLAVAILLLAVASLIGIMVLMYALYALVRGPLPPASGRE